MAYPVRIAFSDRHASGRVGDNRPLLRSCRMIYPGNKAPRFLARAKRGHAGTGPTHLDASRRHPFLETNEEIGKAQPFSAGKIEKPHSIGRFLSTVRRSQDDERIGLRPVPATG